MSEQAQASGVAAASPPAGLVKLVWGALATMLSIVWTALIAPVAALAAPFFNGHLVSHLGRWWAWLIIKTCGVKVECQGFENLAGLDSYIVVSNHQSFFDIFASVAYLPCELRFVAKKELLKIPLFGYALRRSNHVVVDREHGGHAIRRALEISRMGYCIFVLAEGHRFSDNQVHDFKEGAAWLAIHTKLPCVPLSVSGTAAFFPRGARVIVPGGRMRLTVGKPLRTEELKPSDRAALTRQLEQAVRANFVTAL